MSDYSFEGDDDPEHLFGGDYLYPEDSSGTVGQDATADTSIPPRGHAFSNWGDTPDSQTFGVHEYTASDTTQVGEHAVAPDTLDFFTDTVGLLQESAPSGDVIVETRDAEGVQVMTVLCVHSTENADRIARVLEDGNCTTLLIEEVGHPDAASRAASTALLNKLVSSDVDSGEAHLFAAEQAGCVAVDILAHLPTADQRVISIDMDDDHPDRHYLTEANEAEETYQIVVDNLAPPSIITLAVLESVAATAQEYTVRDALLAAQITQVVNEAKSRQEDAPSIGVVLGIMHHRAVQGIGTVDPDAQRTTQRLMEHARSPYDNAVNALREGDMQQARQLVDREVLSAYMRSQVLLNQPDGVIASLDLRIKAIRDAAVAAAQAGNTEQANILSQRTNVLGGIVSQAATNRLVTHGSILVGKLSGDEVTESLTQLEGILSSRAPYSEQAQEAKDFLQALVNRLQEL